MHAHVEVGQTIEVHLNGVRTCFPYPRVGYGGHDLVWSASGRLLALFLYSGQGECAWELFEVEPEVRHFARQPFFLGEGAPPVFSADEQWLAMASILRDIGPDEDDPRALEIEWAELRLQALDSGFTFTCAVRLRFDAPPAERDPMHPTIAEITPRHVVLQLPWGARHEVPIPLPKAIVVDGPRD